MTDYDKKYLWIFIGIEIIAFLFSKAIVLLLNLIEMDPNTLVGGAFELFKGILIPIVLILAALITLGIYKNNRDGGDQL